MPPVEHLSGMQSLRMRGLLFGVLWFGSLGGALVAQRTTWRIPAAGAVEYQRVAAAKASAVCSSQQVAKSAPLSSSMPARYLHQLPPAPVLCQGELRADQRAVHRTPGMVADLRDVLRALAFDLSGQSVSGRFARLLPFGDVTIRGSWSSLANGGTQQLKAAFAAKLPSRQRGESAELCKRLAVFCMRATTGTVVMSRSIDSGKGLVTGFRGEFDLVVDEGERKFRRVHIVEQWHTASVRDNQDFDFRRRVAAAIRGGTGWVRAAIAEDESFLVDRRGERNYGSGRLALGLLTLLHGHVSASDEVVVSGFGSLRKRRLDDAYSLATSLMALSAWHRRASLAERDRKVAARWLARLLTCIDTRTDPKDLLRFNYTSGPRYDTSLQQYGLLGLRAAQEIGLALPPDAFAAAARHLLNVQGMASGSLDLHLTDPLQVRQALGTEDLPKSHRHRAKVRGFAYQDRDDPAFGSMTSAGVSGLLLARAGLLAQGSDRAADRGLHKRIDRAVVDGFAWLAKNFSVRINPGFAERADNHWSYWLYCLERCCELHGVARLQGRDWYYEGGLQLLAAQNRNGSFRCGHSSTLQLDSTCFAILFLAKASAPVPITGR